MAMCPEILTYFESPMVNSPLGEHGDILKIIGDTFLFELIEVHMAEVVNSITPEMAIRQARSILTRAGAAFTHAVENGTLNTTPAYARILASTQARAGA